MRLPADELERRLTEFQIVESEEGTLLGTIGLEVSERQGRIHSEAYHDFALADTLRQYFWARLQSLAENQGLARLWTNESAPFWKKHALQSADAEALKKLPSAWSLLSGPWQTLQLRDENALRTALETDFSRLKEIASESTELTRSRARVFNTLLLVFSIGLFVTAMIFLFKHLPQIRGR